MIHLERLADGDRIAMLERAAVGAKHRKNRRVEGGHGIHDDGREVGLTRVEQLKPFGTTIRQQIVRPRQHSCE